MSKNHPDAGTFDIPIQRAIFGRGCSSEFFEIASRQLGGLREYRFLVNDLHFLDSYLWIRALG